MPQGRPAIPAELRRAVLVEAGHRCAIPACRQHPVIIEHIDDWAKVQKHEFENLIALCPTCHNRKGDGPQQIDRRALRQYKANLAIMNSRYSDAERRLIEYHAEQLRIRAGHLSNEDRSVTALVPVTIGMEPQIWYLVRDGYLEKALPAGMNLGIGGLPVVEFYHFTAAGEELVRRWADAQPIDPPEVEDHTE